MSTTHAGQSGLARLYHSVSFSQAFLFATAFVCPDVHCIVETICRDKTD
jgi:hypothetical protein